MQAQSLLKIKSFGLLDVFYSIFSSLNIPGFNHGKGYRKHSIG